MTTPSNTRCSFAHAGSRFVTSALPTAGQMDDLLSKVRANTNTVLYMHPNLQRKLATEFQFKQMQFVNGATGVTYTIDTYQNIPIVSSYNISWGGESVIAVA